MEEKLKVIEKKLNKLDSIDIAAKKVEQTSNEIATRKDHQAVKEKLKKMEGTIADLGTQGENQALEEKLTSIVRKVDMLDEIKAVVKNTLSTQQSTKRSIRQSTSDVLSLHYKSEEILVGLAAFAEQRN